MPDAMDGYVGPEPREWPVRIVAGDVDVTEHVVSLLDLIVGTLDWGSGFWCQEDVEAVSVIAGLLGIENITAAVGRLDSKSLAELRWQLSRFSNPDRELLAAMHEEVSRRTDEVLAAGLVVDDEAAQRAIDEVVAAARARRRDPMMTLERYRRLGDEKRVEVGDWVDRHFPDRGVMAVTYYDGVATVQQRDLTAPRGAPGTPKAFTETQVAVEEPPPWLRDGWTDA